jgi:tetratricopeptide (TPR) repeat protein
MSRFRPDRREHLPDQEPVVQPQPAVNLVPVSAEDFNRQKRQKVLKWASGGVIAAIVILAFLYRFSMPAAALNHYIDAKKFYDAGKYSDALDEVNRAARDSAQRLNALRLRADIYRSMHQPADAIADITRVMEIEPRVAAHYTFRAEQYQELDDPASAAKDYTRIIELDNSADAYNGRGLCYLKLNQAQKAIDDFTAAIGRGPRVEFYLQRGLAYSAVGDAKKAIADFDQAVRLRPTLSASYRARAIEKQRLGDSAGAERDRQTALNLEKPEKPKLAQVELPNQ